MEAPSIESSALEAQGDLVDNQEVKEGQIDVEEVLGKSVEAATNPTSEAATNTSSEADTIPSPEVARKPSSEGATIPSSEPVQTMPLTNNDDKDDQPQVPQPIDTIEAPDLLLPQESNIKTDIIDEELLWILLENHGKDMIIFINDQDCIRSKEVYILDHLIPY